MYIILTYDSENSNNFNKIAKKYLTWVSNSTFEGEISEKNYKLLKNEILNKLNKEKDSIFIYKVYIQEKEVFGIEKNKIENFL